MMKLNKTFYPDPVDPVVPAVKLKGHQTDILAYRNDLETEFSNALAGKFESAWADDDAFEDFTEWVNARFLSIEVYRSQTDPTRMIVEFLITCGGPHVEIIWDSRWTIAKLTHTWGANAHTGEDQTTIDFKGEIIEELIDNLGIERGD